MDAPAGIPAAAPAGRRARPDHPGLGAATEFTPAFPVRLADGDRPGPGQLARRRGRPRREHPRHRRHHPLARSSAGLRLGRRRAKPQHHARRAGGHRGNAQPSPGSHRAGRQPGPGGGAALPPRQLLAGRTGRLAGRVLAAASPGPARARSIAPHPPRTGHRHGRRRRDHRHADRAACSRAGAPARAAGFARRLAAGLRAAARPAPRRRGRPAGLRLQPAPRGRVRRERPRRPRRPGLARHHARGARGALLRRRGGAVGGEPGARPGGGGDPARERRPGVRDRLGQAARRTRRRPAVRAGGVAADAMDGQGPAGRDRPAAGPPAASGRACQLAGLGLCGRRTPSAMEHLPDRTTRPAARARRTGGRSCVGPGAGSRARRPPGHRGSLRNRPPAGTRPAGCSPATRRGRGSSPAQASPRGCRRCDRGVPGHGRNHRRSRSLSQPRREQFASPIRVSRAGPVCGGLRCHGSGGKKT
jgi:hypothetical protein